MWTDLGGGVRVRQSRAYAMNSLLLLDPEHTVIVDPGVLPSELDDLAAMVADRRPVRVTLVFSHAHWDHVLGRPWWPHAESLAHARFSSEVRASEASIAREAERLAAVHGEAFARAFRAFEPDRAVAGESRVEIGPWPLVTRDAPGHCASQITVHLPRARLLFAADMLSDIEIPMLDGPCATYRRTLEALAPLFEGGAVETLVPGHGSPARGAAAASARLL
ncbi:MAG TPA: MBL fold metallo-hydrolase, partial [Candidatus Eisenbacteria bacterium]